MAQTIVPEHIINLNLLLKRAALLFSVILLTFVKGYGQQFYAATQEGILQQVTITPNGPVSKNVNGCGSGYFSIALWGNKIYYTQIFGGLSVADITGGNTPQVINCQYLAPVPSINSMTADKNGILYMASGNSLYKLDPKNPVLVNLGIMPYGASGDLVFYNDKLYMASYNGIVKVSLDDLSQSKLVIPITNRVIYGLTSVASRGAVTVYAIDEQGGRSELIELDLNNMLIKGTAGSLPYSVYDAGSTVESGEIPVIKLQSINVTRECNVVNKGRTEIICAPHGNPYTYKLNTGESNTTGIFFNLPPGNYQVTITSNGGEEPKKAPFTVPDFSQQDPVVTFNKTDPVCDIAGSIKLETNADKALYRVKYNNAVYPIDHVFADLVPGVYHFSIITPNGCLLYEKDCTLVQEVCPPIVVNDIVIKPECDFYGETSVTVLTADHPDNYTYSLNGISNTTGVFNRMLPGTYQLVITSSGGSQVEKQITIPDFTLTKPYVSYTTKNAICTLAGQVKFNTYVEGVAIGSIKHGGQNYTPDETIRGLSAGTNHFILLDKQGCIITELDITITQDLCEPVTFFNTFTPNGDGVNDLFRPNQSSNPIAYKLTVFNRLGQRLFESESIYDGWNGNYNGKPVPTGVYYWLCNYTMGDGQVEVQKGHVTLLR
ncbi:gliding motility-associated C-terminal domain-containing protein [Mucilaginibacter sp. UC70_90]